MLLSENNEIVHAMLSSSIHFTEYSVTLTVQPEREQRSKIYEKTDSSPI